MTAIITFVDEEGAYFLTDGAGVDEHGTVWPMQKVGTIAHLPMVMAVRGPGVLLAAAQHAFSQYRAFDDAVTNASAALHGIECHFGDLIGKATGGSEWDFYMGGYREGLGFRAYVVTNHFRYEGVLPYTPKELENVSYAPRDAVVDEVFNDIRDTLADGEFSPWHHGLKLMHAMRRAGGSRWAGGFCQVSDVTKHGTRSRILERWPEDFTKEAAA